jgi:hypothetical protein
MTIYRGFGGTNREVKQQFRGLGGVNREIKEVYRGVSGVNRKVFQAGPSIIDVNDGSFLNHTKTLLSSSETVDGSQGFKIVGRPSQYSFTVTYADLLRWEINLDLTQSSTFSFYAKKIVDHGSLVVLIDCPGNAKLSDGGTLPYEKLKVMYNALPTTWTEYNIDVISLSGSHKIGLVGGYTDISGNPSSETQICKIELL